MKEKRQNKNSDIRVWFGEKLREIRNDKKLSQEKFAASIGLTQHRYSDIELGKVDFKFSSLINMISQYEELSCMIPLLIDEIKKMKNTPEQTGQGNGSDND